MGGQYNQDTVNDLVGLFATYDYGMQVTSTRMLDRSNGTGKKHDDPIARTGTCNLTGHENFFARIRSL